MKGINRNSIDAKAINAIIVKFSIQIFNFILVALSANFLGSAGRGQISIIITDVALISFISNITTTSSLSYYSSKGNASQYIFTSLLSGIIMAFLSSWIFYFIHGAEYIYHIIILSFLYTFFNTITSIFLAKNKISSYNILNFSFASLQLVFLLFFFFILNNKTINNYFTSMYLSFIVIFMFVFVKYFKNINNILLRFSTLQFIQFFKFGFQVELGNFFHFLNIRLSYFFISSKIGIAALGVYSVAVAIVEIMLTVGRSYSVVNYSNILNNNDNINNRRNITKSVFNCLAICFAIVILMIFIPKSLYTFIFGKEFDQVKYISLLLAPGVIAVAASTIYNHYFSAIGKLNILITRSLIGLTITSIGFILFYKNLSIFTICMINNVSYITLSAYLLFMFKRK